MGSWSEACGFSGMEIAWGEVAYLCLMDKSKGSLNDGAFHHYAPTTTLLRGIYNDYGQLKVDEDQAVLDMFNAQAELDLKNGDDFSLDKLDGKPGYRWWMHGAAFDFMPTIKQEFGYFYCSEKNASVKVKNIGDSAEKHVARLRAMYAKGVEEYRNRMELFEKHANKDDLIEAASRLSIFTLRDFFGYGDRGGGYMVALQKAMRAGVPVERVEGIIEAYRRHHLLGYALFELRRNLAPCESAGPQHSGEVASIQFAKFILAAQKERKKRWDD